MIHRPAFLAAAAFAFSATQAAAEPHDNLFSALDVFELEYAADPQISPDGDEIVYVRRSNDIMTDRTRSNLWIVDVESGDHRPLLSGKANFSSPRWSPDGARLAYISSVEGSSQIYVRWMDTGATALVTNVQKSPGSLAWSPDGETIAFVMSVAKEKKPLVAPPKKPEGAEWKPPAKYIDELIYRFDGRGYIEPAHTHIFTVPSSGGSPRQLTRGSYNFAGRFGAPLSWTPDGSKLLFSANLHENWELETTEADIFTIDVETGEMVQLTDEPGAETQPVMSPDGRLIAYAREQNRALAYEIEQLYVMDADGGNARSLTAGLDRSAGGLNWAGNSRGVYFRYADRGEVKVGYADLRGNIRVAAEGLGGTTLGRPYASGAYSVSNNGTIAFTRGTPQRPADVAVTARGGTRILTRLNEDLLGGKNLGEVHEIIYNSSFDGQEIQGWYVTPPDFDPSRKYPLILEIHGGPHAAYGPHFSAEIQRMAAAGYVVFYDNHRGSDSYGEEFGLLLQYKYSSPEDFADHMSGVDAMIGEGFIDEENLFVTGGSAGGIATAYLVGLTDRFNAAVAAKPITNWISKTLNGDIYTYQIRHQFPGYPWDEFEHYWSRSPLSLVGNVTTPTMLMTGEQDFRTPIPESEQFYQALKLRGIDTMLVRVPGASHGIAGRPSRLNAKVDHILAWFARYRAED